jgi:hypothetical protein
VTDLIALVPNRPDAEVAKELRAKMETALEPVLTILDEARAAGFEINFNLAPDYAKRSRIQTLLLIKQF